MPPRWRAEGALRRLAVLAGVPERELASRVDAVVARLGLEEHRRKPIKALSKGTLQRLALAQALLRDEDVLILDEPTQGLDPVWTQRFRALVAELRRPERVILIASHNLDELERIADRVAILDRGRVQRVVTTGLRGAAAATTVFRLAVASGADDVRITFPDARPLGDGEFEVRVTDLAALNRGLGALLARGVLLAAVAPAHSALEQQFREAVAGDGTSRDA